MTSQAVAIIVVKIRGMIAADQFYYTSLESACEDYTRIKNAMLSKEVIEVIYENSRMTLTGEDVSFTSFTSLGNNSKSNLQ